MQVYYWTEGNEDPTDTAVVWEDASTGAIFNNDKWEPGYTEAKHIKIVNEGTLALKYQMRILANGVVSELADAIDVYYYETAIQLTADNYKTGTRLGTLSEVLNNTAENAISKVIAGKLEEGEAATLTLAMHMQEEAGNEYQGLSIGTDFSIQILATQYSSESDSFGSNYDAGADFAPQTTPSPMVSALSGDELNVNVVGLDSDTVTLDAGYQFEPTETYEQAQQSTYRYYHADFVVSADKDIPANSLALAGYYALFCEDQTGGAWVALSSDADITAGTEIRLIEAMGSGSITVNYEELCLFGNDGTGFRCGLVALDEEALKGATVTVELRLYETEEPSAENNNSHNKETGKYISAGVFTYNYGAVEVNDPANLSTAMKAGGAIELSAGSYTLPGVTGKDVTITGTKDAVISIKTPNFSSSNVTMTGITVQGNGNYTGVQHVDTVTYNDVTVNGEMCLYGNKVVFNNCEFNLDTDQYIWTYGAKVVEFNNCTFNSKGKALLVYGDSPKDLSTTCTTYINNCKFYAESSVEGKAAIEIDSRFINQVVYIDNLTTAEGFDEGSISGNTLWNNKKGNAAKVYVNEVEQTLNTAPVE